MLTIVIFHTGAMVVTIFFTSPEENVTCVASVTFGAFAEA